jgi:soluble lytic murein transglycosylase-like protein
MGSGRLGPVGKAAMTDQDRLDLPAPGLAPRTGDRRRQDRRAHERVGKEDRRRRDRRRGAVGGLLLTGLGLAGALHARGGSDRFTTIVASQQAGPTPLTARPDVANAAAAPMEEATSTGPFEDIIREAALKYGVDPDLVRAVIRTESNFNPLAKSRAGAKGLMQLMPRLAKELGISDPFDPRENILGGTRLLRLNANRFKGDLVLTIAAYHAGPGAVEKYHGVPPYETTQQYVKMVLKHYYKFKAAQSG